MFNFLLKCSFPLIIPFEKTILSLLFVSIYDFNHGVYMSS